MAQNSLRQLEGARRFEFEIMAHNRGNMEPAENAEWQVRPMDGVLLYDGPDGPRALCALSLLLNPVLYLLHREVADRLKDILRSIASTENVFQDAMISDACKQIRYLEGMRHSPIRVSADNCGVELDPSWCYRVTTKEDAVEAAAKLNEAMSPVVSQYIHRVSQCLLADVEEAACPFQ